MMPTATPKTGWQILAELDLLINDDYENQVQTWITENLSTVGIAPELLDKMLKSALGAISRQESPNYEEVNVSLVYLRLFIPLEVPIRSDLKRNWGFFRIDKHGFTSTRGDHVDHLIEFFLYLDG